ncbi:MAG: acyl carrier protein [Candidatus Vogelbacteria bacterium]|nr:acyl carrier protein [Candidatus Vogelbacteria bacterium]
MTREEVGYKIFLIVKQQLCPEDEKTLTEDADFAKDFGADSLDLFEMVMEIEDAFHITIPDEEANQLKTIGQTIDYVLRKPRR